MAEFIISTTDNQYSYNALTQTNVKSKTAEIKFRPVNNNATSITQGFFPKVQKGTNRIDATVILIVSNTDYENIFIPMLVYPSNVNVTFDRNIPSKTTPTQVMTFDKMRIVRELPDTEYEIELTLREVID
jgi:hypothetical protein